MPAFTTVLGLAAVAGSLINAAPVNVERAAPTNYYTPYLEPYDAYHLRYLALDCQDKHDTDFFETCCHPLVVADGQTLADRPSYCTPNATEVASASSYIASTSASGVAPTATDNGDGSPAATTSSSADDGGASEYSQAASSSTQAPLTTQAALAPTTTSSSQAQPTTTSQSNNGGGNNNGIPSGANYGGYATYFYQNGNPGACGNYNPDSKPLVAIDKAWWPNFSQASQYCGQYVTIQNTQNGKTVVAEVQDVCPTCANGNSLDLSTGAFNQIAEEWQGQVPIVWWFNN